MSSTTATATACGKILLFGEHAVVHGQPAIAIGLPDGATATARRATDGLSRLRVAAWGLDVVPGRDDERESLARALGALLAAMHIDEPLDVELTLALPVGVGLGSSAALGIAAARAIANLVGRTLEVDALVELGFAWEGVFHGTPSGIDHTAAARGGVFLFRRPAQPGARPTIEPLVLAEPLELVVAVAGPASSTREMVAAVTTRVERDPAAREAVDEIGRIVEQARALLARPGSSARLGELMNRNHALLDLLGVNTPALETACQRARQAGALGAKVTGAGGGGCIVALSAPGRHAAIVDALRGVCPEVLCRTLSS